MPREFPISDAEDILSCLKSSEHDVRIMALTDLMSVVANPTRSTTEIDDAISLKLTLAVIDLLSDKFIDVQNLAIRCIGPLATICTETAQMIADCLCNEYFLDEHKISDEINCLAFRSLLRATKNTLSIDPDGNFLRQLCRSILHFLERHSDYVDVLIDILVSDVSIQLIPLTNQISSTALHLLFNEDSESSINNDKHDDDTMSTDSTVHRQPSTKPNPSRLCVVLAQIVKLTYSAKDDTTYRDNIVVGNELCRSLIQVILLAPYNELGNDVKIQAIFSLIQSMQEISGLGPELASSLIRELSLSDYVQKLTSMTYSIINNDPISIDVVNIEGLLGIYTNLIPYCMEKFLPSILNEVVNLVKFDPNCCADDLLLDHDDDETSQLYNDDNSTYSSSDEDIDDLSWRVRRAAIKFISKMIAVMTERHLLDGFDQLADLLINRIQKEVDSTVKLEAIQILNEHGSCLFVRRPYPFKVLLKIVKNKHEITAIKKIALEMYCKTFNIEHIRQMLEIIAVDIVKTEPLNLVLASISFCMKKLPTVLRIVGSREVDRCKSLSNSICLNLLHRMKDLTQAELAGMWKSAFQQIISILSLSVDDKQLTQSERKRLFAVLTCPVFMQNDEIAIHALHCAHFNVLSDDCRLDDEDIKKIVDDLIKQIDLKIITRRMDVILDCLTKLVTNYNLINYKYLEIFLPLTCEIFNRAQTTGLYTAALGVILVFAPIINEQEVLRAMIVKLIKTFIDKILNLNYSKHSSWEPAIASCLRIIFEIPNTDFIPTLEQMFSTGWAKPQIDIHILNIDNYSSFSSDGCVTSRAIEAYTHIVKNNYTAHDIQLKLDELNSLALESLSENTLIWHRLIANILSMSILSYKTKSMKTLIQGDFDTVLKRNLDQHIELVRREETSREVISSCITMCEIGKLCNITSMGNVRNLIINKAIEINDSDLKIMLCAEIAVMDFGCLYTCENNVTILEQRITEIHNKLSVNQNSLPCTFAFFVSCANGLKEFVCETGKIDEIRSIVKLVWDASANDEIVVPEGMNYAQHLSELLLLCPEDIFPQLCRLRSLHSIETFKYLTTLSTIPFSDIKIYPETVLPDILRNHPKLRKLAITTLNLVIHTRGLRWKLWPDTLTALLEHCKVDNQLIKSVDIGPFKHRVDHGLEIRKASYDCIYRLISQKYRDPTYTWSDIGSYDCTVKSKDDAKIVFAEILKYLLSGIMDDTFDIMVLSHLSLCTMLEHKEPLAAVHLHDIQKAIITYCEKLELYEKKKGNDDMRPTKAGISQLNDSKREDLSRIILREIFFLLVGFSRDNIQVDLINKWISKHNLQEAVFNRPENKV